MGQPKHSLTGSALCGATGSAVSLQCQFVQSVPSPAQWVNGSGVATAAAWVETEAGI